MKNFIFCAFIKLVTKVVAILIVIFSSDCHETFSRHIILYFRHNKFQDAPMSPM